MRQNADSRSCARGGTSQFPTTDAGMSRAIAWAGRRTGGDADALWVIEGVATYGARLTALVVDTGYRVAEAPRMSARANRSLGKSDPLDARRIAAAVLPVDETRLRVPRAGDGVRTALRVLLAASPYEYRADFVRECAHRASADL